MRPVIMTAAKLDMIKIKQYSKGYVAGAKKNSDLLNRALLDNAELKVKLIKKG